MRIIACSDTHGRHKKVNIPDGDVLIFAGDITPRGEIEHLSSFSKFLSKLPHKYKIVIAGNHDFCFENELKYTAESIIKENAIYLLDSEIVIDNIKFYGSPWQPRFYNWAFNLDRGKDIRTKWELIPEDTDVLITHGPPYGIRDLTMTTNENTGCKDLLDIIEQRSIKYHIFGHIHEGYGQFKKDNTKYINASICTLMYQPINKPIIFDI